MSPFQGESYFHNKWSGGELRGILALSGKDRSEVIYLDEFDILENSSLVVIMKFLKVRNICATSWSWFGVVSALLWAVNPSRTLCICLSALNMFPTAG